MASRQECVGVEGGLEKEKDVGKTKDEMRMYKKSNGWTRHAKVIDN